MTDLLVGDKVLHAVLQTSASNSGPTLGGLNDLPRETPPGETSLISLETRTGSNETPQIVTAKQKEVGLLNQPWWWTLVPYSAEWYCIAVTQSNFKPLYSSPGNNTRFSTTSWREDRRSSELAAVQLYNVHRKCAWATDFKEINISQVTTYRLWHACCIPRGNET